MVKAQQVIKKKKSFSIMNTEHRITSLTLNILEYCFAVIKCCFENQYVLLYQSSSAQLTGREKHELLAVLNSCDTAKYVSTDGQFFQKLNKLFLLGYTDLLAIADCPYENDSSATPNLEPCPFATSLFLYMKDCLKRVKFHVTHQQKTASKNYLRKIENFYPGSNT